MTSLAPHMEAFLREHLVRHRGASQHTCDSYAYSFQSLFEFAAGKLKVAPSALMLEQLDATLIGGFLEHLESTRGNSAETRNIRLAAVRSFFRFLQHREPAAIEQVRRVLAIPFKRTDTRLVSHLVQEEMQALLDAPDPSRRAGVRDRAMLHLAVCAGLRVSELTGLRVEDVAPQSASIRIRGKGRRERALPLWKTTATALRAWLAIRGPVASPELFVNARGEPFSRWGVAYVLRCHTEAANRKCSTLPGKRVSPHVLRHTCAMVVLQATQDIRKVSLWLGHSNLTTTKVYVRADPTEKLEATHRVAISNNRLLDIESDQVRFQWKDYRHGDQIKAMTLPADEFIRRFLLHVLPNGLQRIRYYGFLGNRNRQAKLEQCRRLIGMEITDQKPPEKDYRDRYEDLTGRSLRQCPQCRQGHMVIVAILPRSPSRSLVTIDSS